MSVEPMGYGSENSSGARVSMSINGLVLICIYSMPTPPMNLPRSICAQRARSTHDEQKVVYKGAKKTLLSQNYSVKTAQSKRITSKVKCVK